jgi:hypothetical protein
MSKSLYLGHNNPVSMWKRRWNLISIVFLILAASLISMNIPLVDGDLEPNNTFLEAEPFPGSSVSGSVESIFNYSTYEYERLDRDIYSVEIPPLNQVMINLKKLDNSTGTITLDSYDENMSEMNWDINCRVSIPGESSDDSFKNRENRSYTIYLLAQGSGDYLINREFEEIEIEVEPQHREEQWFESSDTPEPVTDGSFIDKLDIRKDELPNRHYYLIRVPSNKKLTVSLEKTDDEGILYLDVVRYESRYYADDAIYMQLSKKGENVTKEWDNGDYEAVDMLVEVEGVGSYILTLDTSQDTDAVPEVIMILLLSAMMLISIVLPLCISIMIPLAMVATILIVVMVALKGTKKRKKGTRRTPKKAPPPPEE